MSTKPLAFWNQYVGERFGEWLVLKHSPKGAHNHFFLCRCSCGTERVVNIYNLISGISGSCGCVHREKARIRASKLSYSHGMSNTPEHRSWKSMHTRCYNEKSPQYQYYGARGIKICDRWKNSFTAFLKDMGMRPSIHHSIDRIDVDDGYSPENCRWADVWDQARNKTNSTLIAFDGMSLNINEWADKIEISADTIAKRIAAGWGVDRALTTPLKSQKNNRKTRREERAELQRL